MPPLTTLLALLPLFSLAQAPQGQEEPEIIRVAPPKRGNRTPEASLEAQVVAHFERRLLDGLCEHRPWLARELGLGARGHGLGRYGPDSVIWWASFLQNSRLDMATVQLENLSPSKRVELAWLLEWIEAQKVIADAQPRERWDPLVYVERADRVLRALTESGTQDTILRGTELVSVLGDLPQLWSTARRGLVSPSSRWSQEAALAIVDLVAFLQLELPESIGQFGLPHNAALELERLRTIALRETRAFKRWLEGEPSRAGGPLPTLGADPWRNLARALTGTDKSVGEIKAAALRELARLDREDIGERRELPDPQPRSTAGFEERLQEATAQAYEAAVSAELLDPIRAGAKVQLSVVPGYSQPSTLARLRLGERGGHLLSVQRAGVLWPDEMRHTRESLLDVHAQRAMGMCYGPPGEAYLRSIARQKRGDGSILWNETHIAGWGLYTLDWLGRIEGSPFENDPALRAEAARMRALEGARFVAAIELHAQDLPLAEAILSFARRTGVDPGTAEYECTSILHDPTIGLGFLDALELRDLEEFIAESAEVDGLEALRRTLRLVSANPHGRPRDLRQHLLAEDV